MAGNLYLYFSDFVSHWWPVVTAGGLFGLDAFCQRYWKWGKQKIDRIPSSTRVRIEFGVLLCAVLYAGYAAWSDEHVARLKAEQAHEYHDNGRHLTEERKIRLGANLHLEPNENYSIQFNSAPNCDECEVYAQEFRDFISSIPGWKAGGNVATFYDAGGPKAGMQLILSDKATMKFSNKLMSAFSSASIQLIPIPSEPLQGLDAIIIIARKQK